jgi:hypothetical protein
MAIDAILLGCELSPHNRKQGKTRGSTLSLAHLAGALIAGFLLRMFFVLHFPYYTGDTKFYEEFARNWLDHGVYGLFVNGQLMPVDMRVPGYPAFLAEIYAVFGRTRLPVMIAQVLVDLATCVVAALLAAQLAPERQRKKIAVIALWLTALCPFTAMYTAVPQTEILATFLTTLALLAFIRIFAVSFYRRPVDFERDLTQLRLPTEHKQDVLFEAGSWLLGGLLVGFGTLVRPEAPLILLAAGLVAAIRWRRRADWHRLVLAGCWMAVGLVLPLLPWAVRNARTLGRIQFTAPRYAESYGDYIPRGFFGWTKTWMVRYEDAYTVPWKLGNGAIEMSALPATAFDSASERLRVAALLAAYNDGWKMTPVLDRAFEQLAQERSRAHPLRTYIAIPLMRAAAIWFTPRVETLRYSGHLWPPGEMHRNNATEFDVTLGLWLLAFAYVGLAIVGAWRFRKNPGVVLVIFFFALRTALLTQMQTVEPRYVIECFPALLALAALCWSKTEWKYFRLKKGFVNDRL